MDNQQQFDAAYWLAQPPDVRNLQTIQDSTQREAKAADLAAKGFVIDVPIMVWAWDPYLVMKLRQDLGFTWVPSALLPNVTVAPGITQPGAAPYDPLHPPTHSIRVSTRIEDYPPFDPPAPAVPPVPVSTPVGLQALGNLYLPVAGETYPDGATFTDVRGTFVKHIAVSPFGRTMWWEKIS